MKAMFKIVLAGFVATSLSLGSKVSAQEEAAPAEEKVSFTAGADVYSNYVWRGTKFGTGPSFQPSVKMVAGGLTVGVWGAYDAAGYKETDPYISYSFPFGLSAGLTDYYYEGDFTETSDSAGNHAFEVNLGYSMGPVSISANYILNEAGGAASKGGDMYFQATYAFPKFSAFLGAGNGWHTLDNDDGDDVFGICNIGVQTSKTIEITEKFSVPVTGQIIVNPDAKGLYMAVGFTF